MSQDTAHVTPNTVSEVPHDLTPSLASLHSLAFDLGPVEGPLTAQGVRPGIFSPQPAVSSVSFLFLIASFFSDSDRAQERTHLASAEQGRIRKYFEMG